MDKVKLGVIGLRRGWGVVYEILKEKTVHLSAICDNDTERVDIVSKALDEMNYEGYTAYTDFDEMLKSDIDAVFIANYATQHVPFVIKALEAGKHVLSEIPCASTIDEARQLKAAVKAHPELKYMVAENCCYWGFITAWKKMYDEGKFGETIYAESEYIHSRDWRELNASQYPKDHWRTSHHAIRYLTHNLGPLLHIMNDRCVSVTCMEADVEYNPYVDRKDTGVALFKTEKGAVIRIMVCLSGYVKNDHNFRIIGTRGSIETDNYEHYENAHCFASFSDIPGSREDKIDIPVTASSFGDGGLHAGADRKMVMDFINCVINDTVPPLDVDYAINISIPGILAHESAAQGGIPLEIPEI